MGTLRRCNVRRHPCIPLANFIDSHSSESPPLSQRSPFFSSFYFFRIDRGSIAFSILNSPLLFIHGPPPTPTSSSFCCSVAILVDGSLSPSSQQPLPSPPPFALALLPYLIFLFPPPISPLLFLFLIFSLHNLMLIVNEDNVDRMRISLLIIWKEGGCRECYFYSIRNSQCRLLLYFFFNFWELCFGRFPSEGGLKGKVLPPLPFLKFRYRILMCTCSLFERSIFYPHKF